MEEREREEEELQDRHGRKRLGIEGVRRKRLGPPAMDFGEEGRRRSELSVLLLSQKKTNKKTKQEKHGLTRIQ